MSGLSYAAELEDALALMTLAYEEIDNGKVDAANKAIFAVEERIKDVWRECFRLSQTNPSLGWQLVGKRWRVVWIDEVGIRPLGDLSKVIRLQQAPNLIQLVHYVTERLHRVRKDSDAQA